MKSNNKRQDRSFHSHFELISKSYKNTKKRNSNYNSPFKNFLELHSHPSELKRSSTNELKTNSDLENSEISTNLFNKKKKKSYSKKIIKIYRKRY